VSSVQVVHDKGSIVLSVILLIFAVITIAVTTYIAFSNSTSTYSKEIVIEKQLNDIGNAVANDIMEIVIFLPHGGKISYTMAHYLPSSIAGSSYSVNININSTKENVSAYCNGYSIEIMLTGLKWEINGSINNLEINVTRK